MGIWLLISHPSATEAANSSRKAAAAATSSQPDHAFANRPGASDPLHYRTAAPPSAPRAASNSRTRCPLRLGSSRRRAMEEGGKTAARTVRVRNISDLATEREMREFFSFSGEIEHVDIRFDGVAMGRTAYVTFKDPKALEIALLLSGATIVDQIVNITPAEDYIYIPVTEQQLVVNDATSTSSAQTADLEHSTKANVSPKRININKAHDVITSVMARGSAMRQDAVNRAKAFDEKHQLRVNASARINSFDKRVRLSEKINTGVSVVNEKVKSVNQRLQVSDKTMAALLATERKLNDTGSAVKTSRYVSAGTSWLNGAFSKVAKAGHVAGSRTREKFQIAVSNLTAKGPAVVA